MRRAIPFLIPFVTLACGSGSASSSAAAEAVLATALMQSGVRCAPHEPPSVEACRSKRPGDACQEIDDEGTESGICRTIRDGRLACDDDDERDGGEIEHFHGRDGGGRLPPAPLTDACGTLAPGATCSVAFEQRSFSGTCRSIAGFTVCLPLPEPLPVPVAVCTGKTAGDRCPLPAGSATLDGNCRLFGERGILACVPPLSTPPLDRACDGKKPGDACHDATGGAQFDGRCHSFPTGIHCLPSPPAPPAAAVDACVDHKAQAACSFTFKDHTFAGACEAAPDGPLVCAPVCRG